MSLYAVNVFVVIGAGGIDFEDSLQHLADGCEPPPEEFLKNDVLCVDDVYFTYSGAIEAAKKSLFKVLKSDHTVIGLEASYERVPVTLSLENRF